MTRLAPRTYLSIIAMIDDPEILQEWVRHQASIFRRDPDVVDIEARIVVDTDQGPVATFLDIEPAPVPKITDHPFEQMEIFGEPADMCAFYLDVRNLICCERPASEHQERTS